MSYAQWNHLTQYVVNDVVELAGLIFEATVNNQNVSPLPMNPTWLLIGSTSGGLVQNLELSGDTLSLIPYGNSIDVADATSVASVVTKTQNITTVGTVTDIGGTATVVTQDPADSSTKVANTAFVKSVVAEAGGGNMVFGGASAVGKHCVANAVNGLSYIASSLSENATTFNFGGKDLNNTNLITSTASLGLTAALDVNINATQINSTAPLRTGLPGSSNTYVSTSQVKVQDGSVSLFSNMDINGVEVSNGFDSSKLTFEKLYNNANQATTGSIITIANDYYNNVLNDVTTFTSPGLTLDCPQVDLVQAMLLQSADNIDVTTTADVSITAVNLGLNGITTVTGNTTITGIVGITGATTVTGTSNLNGATTITGATTVTGNLLTNGTTASMNTTGVFGITAGNNIGITTTGASHNITATATGAINLTATGNVNVNASQAEFSATPIHTSSSTTANSFVKIGGTSAEVLLADGTTAPYNSGGSGGNYFLYQSSTDTTVPPSISQHVQYNNSVQPSATVVWINHITDDGIDIDFYLAQVGLGDILYFQDRNDSTNWIKYAVTSITIITNDYVTYGVTYVNSEGTGSTNFPNNHQIFFTSYVDSATINTRLNALEQKTVYQSTPTLNQTNFAGTVYANTLKTVTGTSVQYLMANGSTSALTTIGTSGVGTSLVKTGTSPSFVLNSLAVSTGLSSSLAGDTITLTNSSPASGISLASTGTGTSLLNSTTNPSFSTKSLAVGTGLSIASTTDTITLTNTATASTLANAGAGTSLVVSGTAPSLSVKSLSSGTGITLTDASSNLQITNSSPASGITLSNAGTGTSILSSTSNPTFSTKSLTAGTNVTFTSTANDITINASGGGGGSYTFTNGGTGTTLVSTASTVTDFKPVSITAGTNVTISNSGTDILISSAGVAGGSTLNAVSQPTSASTYYPTFISSATNTTISAVNMDSGGLTYVPQTNTLTAGLMNSVTFTAGSSSPTIGFVGHATSASQVQTTGIPSSASIYYPTFVPTSTSNNSEVLAKDVGLTYRPSDNTLTTSLYVGDTFTSTAVIPAIGFVGAATSASTIQTTGIPSSASIYYPTFVPTATSANNEILGKDVGLTYQPSTNTLSTDIVNAVTFNSSTAVASAGFVGTCSQALKVATTLQDVNASIFYPVFAPLGVSSTAQTMNVDTGLSYQPSTDTLTSATFAGALTGTATRATNVVGAGTNNLLVQTGTNTTGLLGNGTAGQFLQSNGTSLPTWVTNSVVGLQVSFGGLGSVSSYLAPNRWADPASTALATGVSTKFVMPFAGSLVAISSSVTTVNSTTTLAIVRAGVVAQTVTGVASGATNINYIALGTPVVFTTLQTLEIFTGGLSCGVCLFTLYFT